jgi:hypothetical protein
MSSDRGRTLTPKDVAEIWFGTRTPSVDQMRKVYAKMQSGVLPINDPEAPPARWTTNEGALARYLASRRTTKEAAQHEKGKRIAPTAGPVTATTVFVHRGDKDLRDAYANVWREYFLAVMGRRRSKDASRTFVRAVAAGQAVAVILIGLLVVRALGLASSGMPPEQRSVDDHLTTLHGWHRADRWHSTEIDAEGRPIVRVEYRYRDGDSNRVVHTDRTFLVTGTSVREFHASDGS